MDLFRDDLPVYLRYPPLVTELEGGAVATRLWDIPYTIPELGYLTHDHFRYYGKFPSVLAGKILDDHAPKTPTARVLDNFCGSGTTMLEAAVRGLRCDGLDTSWIAAFASNVKITRVDLQKVRKLHTFVVDRFGAEAHPKTESSYEKWFVPQNYAELSHLRQILDELENSAEANFIRLAFLAIIRRVSKAFDAEVRPHINKDKPVRDVIPAFSKKIQNMIVSHAQMMELIPSDLDSRCFVGDNRQLPETILNQVYDIVVSHPPYLNSFNYKPVFNMERYFGSVKWGSDYGNGAEYSELVAHPANETITERYFQHLRTCYLQAHGVQRPGGVLAVVIGDCTRNGVLIPVIDRTIELVESIGYRCFEINYRTTHYGLGKYAYKHRADYHGEAEKKDGVIVFRRE